MKFAQPLPHLLHPDPSLVSDVFSRPLQDVRISVIDRCNFRCTYCMPESEYSKHYTFLKKEEWLTFGEIVRLSKLFLRLGVNKIRLTGGEPLLRPQLSTLIAQLADLTALDDLALTTNGSLLCDQASELAKAGLSRITISLDTLDEATFQKINGGKGSVQQVLNGIVAAQQAGIPNIKLNAVIQKGINEHSILELVDYSRLTGHILRFIEYMDVGNCNHWDVSNVITSAEILNRIAQRYPLKPLNPNYYGEVAERYEFCDGKGEVGFISSVSQPFCTSCTRLRLSTDGKIYTCLFANRGTDLRTPLRSGASDQEIMQIIQKLWSKRNDKYSENRHLFHAIKNRPDKIEMFQIGG